MKAQTWVSVVIYTLISLAIISALIIATKPKIDEARDKFTINYMINAMNELDTVINEVNDVIGTRRSLELRISRGELMIIPEDDMIKYSIITNFKFSEPNLIITIGKINLLTTESKGKIQTELWINYSTPINITTEPDKEGMNLTLSASSTPYNIWIENLGPSSTESPNNTIYISVP